MWDLPGPGLEPMSPALAGSFLTTVPPGKSKENLLNKKIKNKKRKIKKPNFFSHAKKLLVIDRGYPVTLAKGAKADLAER